MLQYDSVHGRFKGEIGVDGNTLIVNGKRIRLTAEKDPAALKWGDIAVDGSTLIVNGTRIRLTAVKDPAELKWAEAGADHAVQRLEPAGAPGEEAGVGEQQCHDQRPQHGRTLTSPLRTRRRPASVCTRSAPSGSTPSARPRAASGRLASTSRPASASRAA